MEKLNITTDLDFYLKSGPFTKPFLDPDYVKKRVMVDYNHRKDNGKNANKLASLFCWIKHEMKSSKDQDFIDKNKFRRTAQEIWEIGLCTGCTDWAILFATFARQLGYPTTFLTTAQDLWLKQLKNNESFNCHTGHSFCESFYNGKWVLVDPTFMKIEEDYNPEKLELSYDVGDSNVFIPYFRGLDLGVKQSVREHNKNMDKLCKYLEL